MRLSIRTSTCLLLLAGFFPASYSWALIADRQQPLKVEADRASIQKKSGISTYSGNVVVRQGSMRIVANKITITTHEGQFQKIVALGQPSTFEQLTDSQHKKISSSARKMTFFANKNIIIFEKNAVLKQGENIFSSDKIVYDISNDKVNAGKKSGGGRVTITIQPNKTEPVSPAQKP